MLVIRLARTGKKKQAYFRVVVQEKHKSPGAKFIEILGNYDPHSKKLEINKDKTEEYMSKGAQPSNTLAVLLKKEGIKLPAWVKITEKNKAPKKQEKEKAEEKAPAEGSTPETENEVKEEVKEEKASEAEVKEEEPKEEKTEEAEAS